MSPPSTDAFGPRPSVSTAGPSGPIIGYEALWIVKTVGTIVFSATAPT